MAFYNEKKYNRALESLSMTPEQIAEIDEGLARLELVERAQSHFRDLDGRFVNRAEAAERLGLELSDELPPADPDGEYIDVEEFGAHDYDYNEETEEESTEDAAWCAEHRHLCVPMKPNKIFGTLPGDTTRPLPRSYRPGPGTKTFTVVRRTGRWTVQLQAV